MNEAAPASIWSGVFPSFAAANGDHGVFEGAQWVQRQVARLGAQRTAHVQGGRGNAETTDYILYSVAAAVAHRPVHVLDFGGGLGSAYFPLLETLGSPEAFRLTVVETAALADTARTALPDVRFVTGATEARGPFDIVHAGSALHYAEDWRGTLAALAAASARHVILAELPAGELPETFATVQAYYGKRIPVWFFRLDDVVAEMRRHGFVLTFHARFRSRHADGAEPLSALPASHRLAAFCQLMFSR